MFTPVKIVRFWLPLLIFVVGALMLIISPDIVGLEGFALMLGGGLGVVVSNRIHRMGLQGEKDRDDEMDARAFLDKYGVWPDEASDEILARAEREGDIAPRRTAADAAAPQAPDAEGAASDTEALPPAGETTVPAVGAPAPDAGAPDGADPHARHPHADVRRTSRRGPTPRPPRR